MPMKYGCPWHVTHSVSVPEYMKLGPLHVDKLLKNLSLFMGGNEYKYFISNTSRQSNLNIQGTDNPSYKKNINFEE